MGLHAKAGSGIKKEIENELPELFRLNFENGQWYKSKNGSLCCRVEGGYKNYGFNAAGEYIADNSWLDDDNDEWKEFTEKTTLEEVEKALIVEARRKGLWGDVKIKAHADNGEYFNGDSPKLNAGWFVKGVFSKASVMYNCNGMIFWKGKWATIIESPKKKMTISDIEHALGHKVEIVS